jgi:hypothetical protein
MIISEHYQVSHDRKDGIVLHVYLEKMVICKYIVERKGWVFKYVLRRKELNLVWI